MLEEELQRYFWQFGEISSVEIVTSLSNGVRRGFVQFHYAESITKELLDCCHLVSDTLVRAVRAKYRQSRNQKLVKTNQMP